MRKAICNQREHNQREQKSNHLPKQAIIQGDTLRVSTSHSSVGRSMSDFWNKNP